MIGHGLFEQPVDKMEEQEMAWQAAVRALLAESPDMYHNAVCAVRECDSEHQCESVSCFRACAHVQLMSALTALFAGLCLTVDVPMAQGASHANHSASCHKVTSREVVPCTLSWHTVN